MKTHAPTAIAFLVGALALGVAPVTATASSAAPAALQPPAAVQVTAKKAWQGPGRPPVSKRKIRKYDLGNNKLKSIKRAKRWASGSKPASVRRCESGNNYRINTGNGYYGAYQFAAGTWRGIGGGYYAPYAHRAPKFAQDHMAYRLHRKAGWGPWGCA